MSALLRLLRPHQWVKNAFVAAPLVFAHRLNDAASAMRTAAAVVAFCLLSGAVYAFNDVRDVEADRNHPTKRRRPVASGQISSRTALVVASCLAGVALTGSLAISWKLAIFAGLYAAQNIAYSFGLKRVAYLDVALISAGFLLRVLAGAAAIDVPASKWLLLCTGLLAALLALGKRAHELSWMEHTDTTTATRAALAGYKLATVRRALPILAAVTCGSYIGYTVAPHTVATFGTRGLVWTAPFVAIALGRFLALSLRRSQAEPPTEAMLRDPIVIGNVVAATATALYAIY